MIEDGQVPHGMEHIHLTKEELLNRLISFRVFITGMGEVISRVHSFGQCVNGQCVIHNPSDHCMRSFPTHWRPKTAAFEIGPPLMERICPHGIGHPDPDHMAWFATCHNKSQTDAQSIHGCDGCCTGQGLE